ncbi:MAG: AAA family ATPase [Candidatus Paracaedibacteraceae bacterium]|nr:AAA family ATPase [Candidatus Paracaedibacteraceae bacterium]
MRIRRFILTGMPGSGKTSVIQALEKQGYTVVHEAATAIITQEQATGIEHPWEHPDFIDKIVLAQKVKRGDLDEAPLQFYDRSPFCTYALAQYLKYPFSAELLNEIDHCLNNKSYQRTVFFFENLGFIEPTDARKITYEEALVFEQIHLDIYTQFGFDLIRVPSDLTIEQRCHFITEHTI